MFLYKLNLYQQWELGKRRDPRRKVMYNLRGKLVKIGVVCSGAYKCAMLKVPGKLPCK